ncbi:MAG: GNAT family N-acetyltransferase [Anaerolineales bacterium]|nr:GNAT family N-acetyltransferase [Anaerolineales bacterium]
MKATETAAATWLEGLTLRLATEADLPALEWEGEYAHFRKVYAQVFARARRGLALMWLAEEAAGRALAQLFVQLSSEADPSAADGGRRAFIHSFRVRAELRGRGLGSRLLAHTEADLLARDFRQACLHVAHDNPAALRFYRRHSYRAIGTVAGEWSYYDHLGQLREVSEPGWRMLKDLSET